MKTYPRVLRALVEILESWEHGPPPRAELAISFSFGITIVFVGIRVALLVHDLVREPTVFEVERCLPLAM